MITDFLAFYFTPGFILVNVMAWNGSLENLCAIAAHRKGKPLAWWMLLFGYLFLIVSWPWRLAALVEGMIGERE